MSLRLVFFCWVFLLPFDLRAQSDSVLLKPVTVYGLTDRDYLVGSTVHTVDTILAEQYASRHLGEILSFQLPVYFRNYGNGMLSGISMRGTAPQHVAVRWNGININSYSLGQADFSLLPAVAFDNVQVHEGGGSARFGSGAMGGTVLLSTSRPSSNILSVNQEVGSFGRFFTSLKGNYSIGKIAFTTSVYTVNARNNFPVRPAGYKQNHAIYRQAGLVQGLQYAFNRLNRVKVNYWYHQSDREIQPAIGNFNSEDKQDDRSHRLSVTYEHTHATGVTEATGGFVDDVIVYNGDKSEIIRWIAATRHQQILKGNWHLDVNAEWNHIIGKVNEYAGTPREERVDVGASLQKSIGILSASFNLRKPFITSIATPFLPYVGLSVMILDRGKQNLIVTANGSRNFRAPTFNDRYWSDLGRKDLLPETSYAAETGLQWKLGKLIRVSGTAFFQKVDEWIQWVPDSEGTFRPQNIKEVEAKGIEGSIGLNFKTGGVAVAARTTYQFTKSVTTASNDSNDLSIGKQLVYTPLHSASSSIDVSYSDWRLNTFFQYSGKRYTESSNSEIYALEDFALVDMNVSRSFTTARHRFETTFTIKNIFNETYTLYSGRAMPGINFNVRLTYHLKHKTS